MLEDTLSALIKEQAIRLGFDDCGITPVGKLTGEEPYFDAWLQNGYNAGMEYMANHREKRLDPTLLVEGSKSVICLLMNYKPAERQQDKAPKVARYAFGADYHEVIKQKLALLFDFIKQHVPTVTGRMFTDSAPVLERAWAVRAGLGWIGKNTTLISPKFGSFTFLAELIVDIELEYDPSYTGNGCGACNRCMANCPTQAICSPKVIDANKCISYHTIENKGEITVDTNGWLFGCDICLQVCPWNKRSPVHNHEELKPIPEILSFNREDWENISEQDFNRIFKHSPLKRTKYVGIQRNLQHIPQKL